ncbi:DNA polymerase III subunit chi [bacterium AH-315-J19]|nr:DNA polymerase III subunit chi [Robiginitomaculum sp.]MBN4058444.1 DNA polymerase III subunit chi [bacterium AH-315-J19]
MGKQDVQDGQVEYWFYHLQQSTLEAVLPDILEKTRAKNWRALIKIGETFGDPGAEMARLDKFLWTYKQDAFLPHGRDDEPLAEHQPILLSCTCEKAEGIDVVILVDGAEMQDVSAAERCITILDGRNEQDKTIARKRWKQANDAELTTAYWQQDDHGRWVKPGG